MLGGSQSLDPTSTPTFAGVKTNANVGTAGTGSTAVEYGDGYTHTTILTVNTTLPAIAGGAALGIGKLLYTFPAGAIVIDEVKMSLAITQTQGNINANTPVVGLGTVIASGVVSTLSGTATFQNILTGQTAANCTGTATVKTVDENVDAVVIETGASPRTVYANVAATWSASGDAAALLTGTVTINWKFAA